jgi:hypothetical protein
MSIPTLCVLGSFCAACGRSQVVSAIASFNTSPLGLHDAEGFAVYEE